MCVLSTQMDFLVDLDSVEWVEGGGDMGIQACYAPAPLPRPMTLALALADWL